MKILVGTKIFELLDSIELGDSRLSFIKDSDTGELFVHICIGNSMNSISTSYSAETWDKITHVADMAFGKDKPNESVNLKPCFYVESIYVTVEMMDKTLCKLASFDEPKNLHLAECACAYLNSEPGSYSDDVKEMARFISLRFTRCLTGNDYFV